jgi:rubrerythrin
MFVLVCILGVIIYLCSSREPTNTHRFVNKFTHMYEKQSKDYMNGKVMQCHQCEFIWKRPADAEGKPCPKCFTPLLKPKKK